MGTFRQQPSNHRLGLAGLSRPPWPPAVVRGKDGKPLYSWRVLLLPYLEYNPLFQKLHLDEPWDSPHNAPLVAGTPHCYLPVIGGGEAPGLTRYVVLVGPGTAFEREGLTWADFPDGPANTILVVETGEPVPWAMPADLEYAAEKPLPALGGRFRKAVKFLCYEVGWRPGFCAVFGDGKARFIRGDTEEATIRALISRNGGEEVGPSKLD